MPSWAQMATVAMAVVVAAVLIVGSWMCMCNDCHVHVHVHGHVHVHNVHAHVHVHVHAHGHVHVHVHGLLHLHCSRSCADEREDGARVQFGVCLPSTCDLQVNPGPAHTFGSLRAQSYTRTPGCGFWPVSAFNAFLRAPSSFSCSSSQSAVTFLKLAVVDAVVVEAKGNYDQNA